MKNKISKLALLTLAPTLTIGFLTTVVSCNDSSTVKPDDGVISEPTQEPKPAATKTLEQLISEAKVTLKEESKNKKPSQIVIEDFIISPLPKNFKTILSIVKMSDEEGKVGINIKFLDENTSVTKDVKYTFKFKNTSTILNDSLTLRFVNQESNIKPDPSIQDDNITYTVKDSSIASVESDGKVKALKNGTTTVEIKYSNIIKSINIEVLNGSGVHTDATYKDSYKLDVIEPTNVVYEKAPVIIFVHGGFWNQGSKSDLKAETQNVTSQALSKKGFAVVTIDYRLADASGKTFPQNIEDVKDAIKYIKSNADKYNIDKNNVGLWGTSAGAHLALMAAYTNDEKYVSTLYSNVSSKVNYVIAINPPVDIKDFINNPFLSNQDKTKFARGLFNMEYGTMTQTDFNNINNYFPATNIKTKLVPTLIFHGEQDHTVPFTQSTKLETLLKSNNNEVTLHSYKNTDHGLVIFQSDPKQLDATTVNDVKDKTVSFVQKHTKIES